ncbi:hypothetical protein C8R44DRAFT_887604 [Mycena epipterygia]|nr:hypothetical protein C8R44DRAFT_887604 [Mycena epipterygia]
MSIDYILTEKKRAQSVLDAALATLAQLDAALTTKRANIDVLWRYIETENFKPASGRPCASRQDYETAVDREFHAVKTSSWPTQKKTKAQKKAAKALAQVAAGLPPAEGHKRKRGTRRKAARAAGAKP